MCIVVPAALAFAGSASALGLPPLSETPPSISGSAVQGQTLMCSQGTWLNVDNATTYAYTWNRDVTTTIGNSANYTVTVADVGQAITCTVTATNSSGSTSSLPSAPVVPTAPPVGAVPVEQSPPVISGTAAQGHTLTCSSGAWSNAPTSYAYSWQRDGSNVGGGSQYTVTGADVNQVITCTVIASNTSGSSAPAVSPPVVPLLAPVGLVPVATALPAITGSPTEGQTVGCSPGSWLNSPTSYSYSWQRDAVAIAGQAAQHYTLTSTDVGQAITCMVVAHNSSGDSLPAISAPIIPALANVGGGGGSGRSGGSGGSGSGQNRGGSGGGTKLHAPSLTFWITPRKVVVLVRGKRRNTNGTTFHYGLNQRAGVLIVIQQRMAGRLKGKSCVAPTRRNARAKRCTRWVTIKTLTVKNARAGSDQLKYAAKVGKRLLAAGAYRAYAAAVSAGGWSRLRSATFNVVTKRVAAKRKRQKPNHHRA